MNVIRVENSKVRPLRGRSRGKGRDSLYWKQTIDRPIANSCGRPKYQPSVSGTPWGLFSTQPSSSVRTPRNSRQTSGIPTSASKIRSSTSSNVQATSTTSTLDSTVVMAITTGRGDARCEVGMAAIDVKYPHLIICQISDTQTYTNTLTKIHLFNPIEILMPDTICGEEDPRKALYNIVKAKFKDITITPIERIHFNEENGLDRIKRHCSTEFSSIELFVKEKYYALSTTAVLLKYVEHIQRIVYEPKSMKIEFQASQGSTLIDIESAINLELVSSQGAQKNHNLFSSLNRCLTPMGRRLLRSSILQPLCDRDAILERQTCVSELVGNRNLHTTLQPIIKQLYGADRALGLSMRAEYTKDSLESAERNLNYVLLLKTCLDIIPQFNDALENATSPKFLKIRENLGDPGFQRMKDQILQAVHVDAKTVNGYTSANMQRCFAVKSGISDMLDVLRQTYCELMEQTSTLVDSLAQKYHLPLTVACNASLGYHIQMQVPKHPSFKISDLPNIFIEVQKKRNVLFMTTYLLMSLSQQCKDVRNDLYIMSSCILELLICNLRKDIGCLFQLSEDIAEVDVIMSLARISAIPDYVKPKFAQNLRIIDSNHPILDLVGNQLPRPNDIEASIPYNFCNITGPNMSGKSTYLKQIVLLHIMAQIGCYLPAKEATLRVADRIFCRLCPTYEDVESNASSFIHEIREIEYILQFITPSSLVVLDEICRSTSSEEGSPLAFAICEALLEKTAFIFNCTHYIYLTKLTELYHNAVNYYFVCEPNELDKWGLKYTYKLRKGITNVENYGISAATACRLPKSIIDNAKQIITKIAPQFKPPALVRAPKLQWQKECYDCVAQLMDLIIDEEFTLENVLKVVDPLRGNVNLRNPRDNDLLCNVLQKNFQKQAPNLENNAKSQISTSVPQTNARNQKIIQYNHDTSDYYENVVVSDTKILNIRQDNVQGAKILQNHPGAKNYTQTKSSDRFSNTNQFNPRESNIIIDKSLTNPRHSDFNSSDHSFPPKSSNSSRETCKAFQQRELQQLDDNFSFKIPASPLSRIRTSSEIIQRNSNKNSEFRIIEQEDQNLEKKSECVDNSLAGPKTLFDFGFSMKKTDCLPKSTDKETENEIRIDSFTRQISEVANLVTEKSSSNLSAYSMRSKMGSVSSQEETSENSRPRQQPSISSLNTPRNWLQSEIISASTPSRKFRQCDDKNSKLSYSKNSQNFDSSSHQEEFETDSLEIRGDNSVKSQFSRQDRRPSFSNLSSNQNSNFEKNWRSGDDNVSSTAKSQVLSISNFSPRHSLERGESSGNNFVKILQSDDNSRISREMSFTTSTPSRSVLDRKFANENSPNFTLSTSLLTQDSRNISGKNYPSPNYSPYQISHETDSRGNISEKKEQSDESNLPSSHLTPTISHKSPESQISLFSESCASDDSDSRSYLSPSYSPLPVSNPREVDSASKDNDNISESLSRKWDLEQLRNQIKLSQKKDDSPLSVFRNSPQCVIKSSPYGNKSIRRNSPHCEIKSSPVVGQEMEFLSQKRQFADKKDENPIISMFKNSLGREVESKSPQRDNPRAESQNPQSTGLNLFKFSTPQSRIAKLPTRDTWKSSDLEYFKQTLQSQQSHNFSQQSISNEIETEGLLPRKPKVDINSEKFKLNLLDDSMNDVDSLSSFNTANFSLSLASPRKQSQVSSSSIKNSPKFSFLPAKNSPNFSSLTKTNLPNFPSVIEKNSPKPCGSQYKSPIELSDKISQYESIIDENTIDFEGNSELDEETNNDVYSISSDDTIQAADNVRRKEDEIFREIEENAQDDRMFFRRLFNSPLSMDMSQELCSCSDASIFSE